MNEHDTKLDIVDKLLSLPYAHRVGPNQIALRCAFCGDSKRDPRKTRFYVQPNINSDVPMLYNCFNCGVSGIVTPQVLRTFEINDLSLNSNLLSLNKSINRRSSKSLKIKDNKLSIKVPIPLNTNRNKEKKLYIENRLGRKFTTQELVQLKTVFSLEQLLTLNHIGDITCKPEIANMINDDYVGFLTVDNGHVIYRDITNQHKLRYNKYSIVPTLDTSKKFYTIPNQLDIISSEPVYIHIAEGVFDILGVYYHIKNEEKKNHIYLASCDSSFLIALKYFIGKGFIGDNIHIELYSDNDHEPYFYHNLNKELKPWVGSIKLFYNSKEKDYGVPKSSIHLMKKTIP